MRSVAFHLSYTVLHLLTRACVQVFSSPWKALFLKALDHKVIKVGVFDSRGLHSVKHSLWAWVRQFLALCERRLGSFLDVISEQDPEALCFGQFNAGRVSETHFGRYQDRYRHSNIRERGDIYRHRVSFITSLSWWLNVQTRIDKTVQSHRPGDGKNSIPKLTNPTWRSNHNHVSGAASSLWPTATPAACRQHFQLHVVLWFWWFYVLVGVFSAGSSVSRRIQASCLN